MHRTTAPTIVSEDDAKQIEQWLLALGTPQCRIVQAAACGHSESAIAATLEINRKTVRLWRERFSNEGLNSLWEIAPGRGRKPVYGADRNKAVIDATLQTKPKGITHWSCRLMASNQGLSKSTISTLWQRHNIKPHRTKKFKLSRDPKFLEKLTDVVGLYLNPPDKAIVLCADEKSQIQALDRTQPGQPLKKGRCGTMTHDYKRNGTTTLLAALDVLQGKAIGDFHKRHVTRNS
jgi:transposase